MTINNLFRFIYDIDRIKNLLKSSSQKQGVSVEDLRKELEASIPAKRLGTYTEFGEVCAFLCSKHAGFIIGQNILVDGGAVNVTL